MLSLACQTAIKAVIFIASQKEKKAKSSILDVARFIDASEHTVGKILQTLVKMKVINSLKGPNGGFYLSTRQINQPIINIVKAFDGKDIFKRCGLGLSKCSSARPCPIHRDFKQVRDLFEKLCRDKKIKDLYGSVSLRISYLVC